MKKGDRSSDVTNLQLALLALGEHLPKWGADGVLGDETLNAAAALLVRQGRMTQSASSLAALSDNDVTYILTLAKQRQMTTIPTLANLLDRRQFAGTHMDMGPRTWSDVKGWCLHQTACRLSSSKDVARCDKIGAHWVVYPSGLKIQLHDIERMIVHGNGWNHQTIGIEIDGLFAGIEGDPKTVWDDPSTAIHERADTITPEQIQAVKDIIYHDRALIIAHGFSPTVIVAHRQASGDRENDPGSKVWQQIAIPLLAELHLSDGGPGFALHDGQGGKPIPEAWDPSRKGIPY